MSALPAAIDHEPGLSLVKYDAMVMAIAAAYEVDEVKDIRDRVAALEHYSRQAHNTEAERRCCEIRLRAERKAGELLAVTEKAKPGGDMRPEHRSPRSTNAPPTLRDLGISKDQSSNWQRLAQVPAEQFEAALAAPEKPSTTGIIAAAFPRAEREWTPEDIDPEPPEPAAPKPLPVSHEALWIWGRLFDFKRDGLLDREPPEVLATMLPHMVATVRELAPQVAAWLQLLGKAAADV